MSEEFIEDDEIHLTKWINHNIQMKCGYNGKFRMSAESKKLVTCKNCLQEGENAE